MPNFVSYISGYTRFNIRQKPDLNEAWNAFTESLHNNPSVTIEALKFSYDIRYGLGRRDVFEYIVSRMASMPEYDDYTIKLVYIIPKIGRWSTLIKIAENATVRVSSVSFGMIKKALLADNKLVKKWLPRKGRMASRIRGYLKLTPKEYRKLICSHE